VVLIVQLTGGNDGLNTVVPYEQDAYHNARPVLGLPTNRLIKLTDGIGLHPSLAGLSGLWDDGALSIVHGVGYPDPVRSHFRSMEIWHTARTDGSAPTSGWLGHVAGRMPPTATLPMARIGGRDLPLALAGAPSQVPAIASLKDLRPRHAGRADTHELIPRVTGTTDGRSGDARLIAAAYAAAFEASLRLDSLPSSSLRGFPPGAFGKALALATRLIGAHMGSRVLYVTQNGYDTHANQLQTHSALLRELGDGLAAVQAQLRRQGDHRRVVTFVFSEFGRRIHENASGGTDHGAGNPVLLVGEAVAGGLVGPQPTLEGPVDGDVPMAYDFRSLYMSLLGWLGVPASEAIPGDFRPLPLWA
jgi:uncharacterized protein (DUF1501 family)